MIFIGFQEQPGKVKPMVQGCSLAFPPDHCVKMSFMAVFERLDWHYKQR